MRRSIPSLTALAVCVAVPFTVIVAHSSNAEADDWPTGTYVASYEPVYYNGFAHYFYHNHWYYRDHGAWRGYDHEPGFLHDRRGEWAHHAHHWR
jgi:hypothetical protein